MTQEISSLMDGELEPHESDRILKACCADPDSAHTWHAYHVIGEVLRGQRPGATDLASGVMAKLQAEPTVLAPRGRRVQALGRIALATAASVATIGVVGWIGTQGVPGAPAPTVARSTADSTAIAPVALTAPATASAPAVQPAFAPIDVHDYLAAHRQIPAPDSYRTVAGRAPAQAR